MKYTPRIYQRRGIKMLLSKPHGGLFLSPGLGKTSTTLASFKLLRDKGFVNKVLVIAPRRVCLLVWPKEAQKWDQFKDLRVHFLHGKGRDLSVDADVYLINPEGLEWLVRETLHSRRWPFEWLVVDESTKFKKTNTKRFKLLKTILTKFQRRTILTGTPTPKGLLDLFGQMYVVDQGKSLGRYVTHYRNEFFNQTGFGGYTYVPKPGALEQVLRRVAPVTLTMTADDWLEMPKLIENIVRVELPLDVRAKYLELEREMLTELGKKRTLVAGSAAIVAMKCRQMVNGGVYTERIVNAGNDNERRVREVVELHTAKVDALEELIEERNGDPTLVVYSFEHDLTRIRHRLGAKVPAFESGLSDKETLRLEAAWNAGDLPVLLAQPQSTSHGLNLQDGGANLTWFSMEWDYEVMWQMILRLYRQGQRRAVTVDFLVVENSVDEDVLAVYRGRHRDQTRVMDLLKVGAGQRVSQVVKQGGSRR